MKNKTATIRLNAFHRDSGAHYSKIITVESVAEFVEQESLFDKEVPFTRFYFEHEFVEGDELLAEQCEAAEKLT